MKIKLITPKNGEIVSQKTDIQKHFSAVQTADNSIDWLNLSRQGSEQSYPNPVLFAWDGGHPPFTVTFSNTDEFCEGFAITCEKNRVTVDSFFVNQTYFWRITDALGNVSDTFSFTTENAPPRRVYAQGLSNIRDAGGYRVKTGVIRQGLVFRGSEMDTHHEITEEGKAVLNHRLKIKTDLDIRGEAVGLIDHSPLGEDVQFFLIPARAYKEFLLEEEKETARKIFSVLADKKNYPVYYHCWGGADRTGTIAFLLGAVLGMHDEDLYLDYELTSLSIWGVRSRNSDLFSEFMEALSAIKGDNLQEKSENFLISCGVTTAQIKCLRENLIDVQ